MAALPSSPVDGPTRAVLPHGVRVVDVTQHDDDRGAFAEVYRAEWSLSVEPVQWGLGRSRAGVVRGVHVHPRHTDYLCVVEGRMTLALKDMRPTSPTFGLSWMTELDGSRWRGVVIPPGVAHGFQFPEPAVFLLGTSHYYDLDDELACRWDDPDLGFDWPSPSAQLSPRDRDAGSFAALQATLSALLG